MRIKESEHQTQTQSYLLESKKATGDEQVQTPDIYISNCSKAQWTKQREVWFLFYLWWLCLQLTVTVLDPFTEGNMKGFNKVNISTFLRHLTSAQTVFSHSARYRNPPWNKLTWTSPATFTLPSNTEKQRDTTRSRRQNTAITPAGVTHADPCPPQHWKPTSWV